MATFGWLRGNGVADGGKVMCVSVKEGNGWCGLGGHVFVYRGG